MARSTQTGAPVPLEWGPGEKGGGDCLENPRARHVTFRVPAGAYQARLTRWRTGSWMSRPTLLLFVHLLSLPFAP